MDNSVAVFVDGTPGCEAALHYAVRLASNRHGKIVLATTSKAFNDSMVEAESYLDRMAMRLRHEDIVIQRHISICTASSNDDLVPSIQAAVALYRSSAIVTSAKLANASSAHLIKLTHIPIIHVHSKVESSSRPRIATKPILVPLDKSEFSEQALPFAIDMARSANVPLVLLHVVPSLRNALYTNALAAGQPWSFLADETLEAEEAVIVQDAHRYLDGVCEKFNNRDCAKVLTRVQCGSPAQNIVRSAQAFNAGAVVMAAHPSNVFCKLIGGSVTDQVVRWIERTVLTINFPGASSKSKMRPPRLTSKCNLKPKIAIFLLATLPKSAP